jgi:uncharacterized protein YjbI with pentapeptide repeats
VFLNYYGIKAINPEDYYFNLLVEATSIVIEFLIFGLFLNFIIEKHEQKTEIKKLENEIDYIRLLKTEEAKFKVFGLIKQLNELNITSLRLIQCNLSGLVEFSEVNLTNSSIHSADFSNSIMKNSILNNVNGERTKFIKTNLSGALIKESNFKRTEFDNSKCKSVNFSGTQFDGVSFKNTDLTSSKFLKCKFKNCDFSDSNLVGAIFIGSEFMNVNFANSDVKNANFNQCINFQISCLNNATNYSLIKNIT